MSTLKIQFVIVVTLLLALLINIDGDSYSASIPNDEGNKNSMTTIVVEEVGLEYPGSLDCSASALICNNGEILPRSVCCRNRCVDLTSDPLNCGLCGFICPSPLRCCNRLCVNPYISPFNCGQCGRVCPIGRLCFWGSCALENPSLAPLVSPSKIQHLPIPKE
ncbi:unnamed protein product [Vicia faba]|uniref:Uncharacterized protein n=1 Tax=Vicia faba TaxID=3906 RepID=A0AAV0YNZ0_VICFA|nr:unnamed protein product [Vicia faba]